MENLFSVSFISVSWLINYTRDVSILICMIFLIKLIVGRRLPAWWSYSLWLLLLFRMLIPWDFQNAFYKSDFVPVSLDADIIGPIVLNHEVLKCGTTSGSFPTWQALGIPIYNVFIFLWLSGALILGAYILTKNIRFLFMIKRMPVLTEKRALDLLAKCKERMKIGREVEIIITEQIRNPALLGYVHPRLILPQGFLETFSDEEISYVFMHELGHLKRHDIAISWLMALIQVIQWFNPLVWLAFYQIRIDQEAACDSVVLSKSRHSQRIEYANVIVSFLEKYHQNNQLASMAYLLENKTQIKNRLAMIVTYRKHSKRMTFLGICMLIVIGLFLFGPAGFVKANFERADWDLLTQDVVEKAHNAIQGRNYTHAEEILAEYLANNPKNIPKALYAELAEIYTVQRKFDEALAILQQGHMEYPEDDEIKERIINGHAQQLFEKQEYIEAGLLYEKIYEIYPDNKFRLALAAESYFHAGYIDEADRVYKRMIDLHDDLDVLWLEVLIRTSDLLGMKDEAEFYRSQLDATGIYSDLLLSDEIEINQGDSGEKDNICKVYSLIEVNNLPKIIKSIKPRYPVVAAEKKISGMVTLRFVVTKEGDVRNPLVIKSEPKGVFDESALEAIRGYRFESAIKNGEAVDVVITAPISYNVLRRSLKRKSCPESICAASTQTSISGPQEI